MKFRTEIVREGEYLGPIDWSFDFTQFYTVNPEILKRGTDMLRELEAGGDWEATTDGGWPRFGWGQVLQVGMYDGWPFWKPVPSVRTTSVFGSEWHPWYSITEIRKR